MFKYFAGFTVSVGLLILLIVLIFGGGGKPKVNASKPLNSYASTDAEASLTIDGPIVADQNHQAVKITVGRDTTGFELIQGYQDNVVKLQTYPNNVDAYSNFLFALARAGFTDGNTASNFKDERGYCPLGDRYIFEFDQAGQQLEKFWTTNCSGTPKTYNGNASLTLTLFRNQIPDYDQLISNVNL